MVSNKLILSVMVLTCLVVQAYATDDSPAGNTYSDPAVNELKQAINGPNTAGQSFKGQPWATSSLNESNKKYVSTTTTPVQVSSMTQGQSTNYMVKVDSFLKGAAINNFYILTASDFVNGARVDPTWVIIDIRSADLYAQGHIQDALSIPLVDLISKMGIIPAGKKVVVYGDTDANAAFAVETLRVFSDRDAYVLQGGVVALQNAGMFLVV